MRPSQNEAAFGKPQRSDQIASSPTRSPSRHDLERFRNTRPRSWAVQVGYHRVAASRAAGWRPVDPPDGAAVAGHESRAWCGWRPG